MSRKNKFDLTALVHEGYVQNGETFSFVSDPSKKCQVIKMFNGEYKVTGMDGKPTTIHAFVQTCLGTEAPDHASKWLKNDAGKTFFDLWNQSKDEAAAA